LTNPQNYLSDFPLTQMDFYWLTFFLALKISLILTYLNYRGATNKDIAQKTFQRNYLTVYTLAYFADWLKGPYVYALYESYGLTEHDIALLFIAGFGASGLSGPLIGSLADRFGRKKCTLAYFLIYIASALCKPFPQFHVLLLGRILGGIGTSLLTTTLESWMVAEHQRQKFPQDLLDDTFAKATLCNSGSAVLAGLLAQATADQFGYLAPFMVAITPLTTGFLFCWNHWETDSPQNQQSLLTGFQEGLQSMDDNLWILGITQSLFLGAMYTFVFLWTPALDATGEDVPYGLVFAIFMVMISLGSDIFKRVSQHVENIPYWLFGGSAVLMAVTMTNIGNPMTTFVSFILFEVMCGIMFPTFGSLRATYIPNEHRTVVMNLYRIPLNAFVVIVLLNKKNMSLQVAFGVCCAALVASGILWRYFKPETKVSDGKEYTKGTVDEEEEFGLIEEELESDDDDEMLA